MDLGFEGEVEFESLDGAPVRLVWMLAGPERTSGIHVRTLAAISELLRDEGIRSDLLQAAAPAEFLALVAGAESA